ncbi:hypothetical protein [Adhaeretor mobilis]|uniref:Uncharacterized protein n=1 Tax=Adhaeretor mobilis TaxID=1930276 RepID=A0A517N3A0_9BACT|nr:hypothetical protein [Adhaeretor mobilis]QDT01615.1 hypothetical protein HG15A2_49620 [Adhaeretor mobilis]
MKTLTQTMMMAAMGLWLAAPAAAQVDLNVGGNAGAGANAGNAAQRAGQGVQRAAEGVGNAAQRVQQGARNLGQGARDLTGEAAQRTRQGAQNLRNAVPGQQGRLQGQGQLQDQGSFNRNGIQAGGQFDGQYRGQQFQGQNYNGRQYGGQQGINGSGFAQANTPNIPAQVQADANFNAQADRNARWRKIQHNGEWWYYSPKGNWMYQRDGEWQKFDEQNFQRPNGDGSYSAAYRGGSHNSNDMYMRDGQRVFRLQSDNQGRQFIRMNGQQLWVGSDANASAKAMQDGKNSGLGLEADTSAEVETE